MVKKIVQGDQNDKKKCKANNAEAIQFYAPKIRVVQ